MTPASPQAFQQALLPGETLYWCAAPQSPWLRLYGSDLVALPFMTYWCWHTFQWTYFMLAMTVHHEQTRTPPVLGVCFTGFVGLFALAGVLMLVERFCRRPWRLRQTVYAITSQRVLILRGQNAPLKAIPLTAIQYVGVVPTAPELWQVLGQFWQAYHASRLARERVAPQGEPSATTSLAEPHIALLGEIFRRQTESIAYGEPRSVFLRLTPNPHENDDEPQWIPLEALAQARQALAILRERLQDRDMA